MWGRKAGIQDFSNAGPISFVYILTVYECPKPKELKSQSAESSDVNLIPLVLRGLR